MYTCIFIVCSHCTLIHASVSNAGVLLWFPNLNVIVAIIKQSKALCCNYKLLLMKNLSDLLYIIIRRIYYYIEIDVRYSRRPSSVSQNYCGWAVKEILASSNIFFFLDFWIVKYEPITWESSWGWVVLKHLLMKEAESLLIIFFYTKRNTLSKKSQTDNMNIFWWQSVSQSIHEVLNSNISSK